MCVQVNVCLPRGSWKQGFKNAPEPYYADWDMSRIFLFLDLKQISKVLCVIPQGLKSMKVM